MTIHSNLRRQLEELTDAISQRGLGTAPLVCGCRRVGEYGEARPPGLYRGGGGAAMVVFEGDEPDPAMLATCFPGAPPWPLLIGGEADPTLL